MFIWKNNMLICRSDLRFRKHWLRLCEHLSIQRLSLFIFILWLVFIYLFYYYKYHRHYYRKYYYHFLFYSKRPVFFPRVTIFFLGGFLAKTPCIESNCSFETRWTFDAEQCSIKFHIKKSRFFVEFSLFYRVGMSICKEQIGDKILVKLAYSEVTSSGFRNAVTNK